MIDHLSSFLLTGIILGLSAGFAPGPLMTLVISETLRHGVRSGLKVALAPLVTDLAIVLVTLFVFANLSRLPSVAGIISLAGGCFVLWLGYGSLRTTGVSGQSAAESPRSLAKGIVTNVLSPHPYLFWLSVGAPTVTRAMGSGILSAAAFIAGFYLCLVGSKVLIAVMAGRSRHFLHGKTYIYTVRILGLLLCILALMLFRDGLRLLGLI